MDFRSSGVGSGGGSPPSTSNVVYVNADGSSGATASPYTAKPYDTVIVDPSKGSVVINMPALAVGQWMELGEDESTTWGAQTITLNAPGGVKIASPPPNNNLAGFTAAGGALVFPISPATAAQSAGFLQRWTNTGSATGYLCK